jgi:uncharacterized protein YcfL
MNKNMKLIAGCILLVFFTLGCSADSREAQVVDKQQTIYTDSQPAPFFD